MPITFELIDVVILIGICQGIFLSLTLQRITNNNKAANNILSILILICTFMLIGRFFMLRFFSKAVFLWSLLFDIVIFLFGPLFYSYTRKLLLNNGTKNSISRYHFLPALCYGIIAVSYVLYYTPLSYYDAFENGELKFMFQTVSILGMISNFLYLFLSFKVLRIHKQQEKYMVSFQQTPIVYLRFFLYAISVIIVTWFLTFFNIKYLSLFNYDVVWAVIPVFIYVIGYFSLKQPELFRVSERPKVKEIKKRLNAQETTVLKTKLNSLMINDKVFLKSDLTLMDVSAKINTSTNNVSWLLNNIYKMTFYDFVNNYRIKEFIKKVDNKEHLQHTILALSMDVGFNSKSTFNKAFKLNMNTTPSDYIKKHRAA